tara:strand:- start:276 stop:419 length:144 start_codon:yes stop_codon:yes gene_type:complete
MSAAVRQSADLVIVGEARSVKFGEQEVVISRDFERAGASGRDLDGCT